MKIKDIISDIKSGDWGKDTLLDNYTESVYCIRGADIPNINNREKKILPCRFIKSTVIKNKALLKDNLVVEISGGSPTQSTGRIALISEKLLSRYDKNLICSNFCKVITVKNINPAYLYYYWQYLYKKGIMFSYENGTTGIKNLDLESFIEEQEINVPSPDVQQKIVEILGALDDKIELNRRINDNLEQQAQALFKSWFVDFEPFKDGNFVDSELGKIPERWRVGNIYTYLDVVYGAPYKSNLFNTDKKGLPLIRIRDLKTFAPQFYTEEILPNTEYVEYGDIVAGMDAEFVPYIWKGNKGLLNQRVCKFIPKYDYVSRYYILFLIRPELKFVQSYKVGTTVSHLGKFDIDKFRVIIPPSEIIKQFSNIVEPFLQQIIKLAQENLNLSALRDTILPKLMAGEIKCEL